jgi:hypothetical protein
VISIISGETSPSPSLREASSLDSSAFGALIAALFAQLGSVPDQSPAAAPTAPATAPVAAQAAAEGDASEPPAEPALGAAALASLLAPLGLVPQSSASVLAAAPEREASAGVAVPANVREAAAALASSAQRPAPLSAPRLAQDDSAAALGRELTAETGASTSAPSLADLGPASRALRHDEPAAPEPVAAPAPANAPAREPRPEPARATEARGELAARARDAHVAPSQGGPAFGVLPPRRTPELGLEPLPRDATPAFEAAPRVENPPALAPLATDRPSVQRAAAPNNGPILERVAWLAEQGGGSARLRLDPPALGELEIVVRVRGRRVDVHLRAEEAGAQQAVLESRERLVESLAAKDFRVDEFSVGGGSREQSEGGSGAPARERSASAPFDPRAEARSPAPTPPRAAAPGPAPTGAIDLRV